MFNRNDTAQSICFLGAIQKKQFPFALILEDGSSLLKINDNSKIIGDVRIPKGRLLNRDNINHISGRVEESIPSLYQLDSIKNLFLELNSVKDLADDNWTSRPKIIFNSFLSKELSFHSKNSIKIENSELRGKIRIVSNEKIIVERDAILEDVILCAPQIIFKSGFQGSCQAFSTEKITANDVILEYPSALVILRESQNSQPGLSLINSHITGIVLSLSKNLENHYDQIEGGSVTGAIISEGSLNLTGKINGAVRCESLLSIFGGTINKNELRNTEITNTNQIDSKTIAVFDEKEFDTVIKWLD